MPYKSDAQRRWAHTKEGTKALGGKAAVHEWDEATKGKKLPEHSMSSRKSKKHPYKRTVIDHHEDGSHTVRFEHKKGPEHDKTHAVADLDAVHDKLEENVGEPNPGEAEAEQMGGAAQPQADSAMAPGMVPGQAA